MVENEIQNQITPLPISIIQFDGYTSVYHNLSKLAYYTVEDLTPKYVRRDRTVSTKLAFDKVKLGTNKKYRQSHFHIEVNLYDLFRTHYKDYKGYDIGHMAKSQYHQKDNYTTFTFVNTVPMYDSVNRIVFKRIEDETTRLILQSEKARLYTGSTIWNEDKEEIFEMRYSKNGMVVIPTHLFKILFCRQNKRNYLYMWLIKNSPEKQSRKMDDYLCNVEKMEIATGLKLFEGIQFSQINYKNVPKDETLEEKDIPLFHERTEWND